jgi:hypothetical protein
VSTLRLLFDEHVPDPLAEALNQAEPALDLICVGDGRAPQKGTKDPELLKMAEAERRAVVTFG